MAKIRNIKIEDNAAAQKSKKGNQREQKVFFGSDNRKKSYSKLSLRVQSAIRSDDKEALLKGIVGLSNTINQQRAKFRKNNSEDLFDTELNHMLGDYYRRMQVKKGIAGNLTKSIKDIGSLSIEELKEIGKRMTDIQTDTALKSPDFYKEYVINERGFLDDFLLEMGIDPKRLSIDQKEALLEKFNNQMKNKNIKKSVEALLNALEELKDSKMYGLESFKDIYEEVLSNRDRMLNQEIEEYTGKANNAGKTNNVGKVNNAGKTNNLLNRPKRPAGPAERRSAIKNQPNKRSK